MIMMILMERKNISRLANAIDGQSICLGIGGGLECSVQIYAYKVKKFRKKWKKLITEKKRLKMILI